MQLIKENQAIRIQKYVEKAIFAYLVRWTSFYQETSPEFKSLSLDIFSAVRILVFKASRVQKMITKLEKSELIDYFNNN